MQPGDYCKRSIDDMRSGVVLGMSVQGRLAHVISGELVEGWKTMDDLQEKRKAEIGDYVAYNDWIGQARHLHCASEKTDSSRLPLRLSRFVTSLSVEIEGVSYDAI
jgi:ubiquitin-conjugating enzyme E2 O